MDFQPSRAVLDASIARAAEIGVDIDRGRIARYRLLLATDPNENRLADLLNAAFEAYELEAVGMLPPVVLEACRARMHSLCDGPDEIAAGADHDPGRDLAFELNTAATFAEAGYRTEMGGLCDVVVQVDQSRLLIECKRPTTRPALRRRIIEAYRQASDLRRAGRDGFFAVALDLGVLVNPDGGMLEARTNESASAAMILHIQRMLRDARGELQRAARNFRNDAGVHLLLLRFRTLVGSETLNAHVRQLWHVEPLVALDSPQFRAMFDVISRLNGFIPEVHAFGRDDPRVPSEIWAR